MSEARQSSVGRLMAAAVGEAAATRALDQLVIAPGLLADEGDTVSRAAFAMALNGLLFADLLARVPSGRAYVEAYGPILFDHGALRTILFPAGPTGALPGGQAAFARILAPLGYEVAGLYPLPKLRMTGRAWRHRELPESVPQFFVSELHVDQFGETFQAAAARVFGASRDPLDDAATALLATFAEQGRAPFVMAAASLPAIVAAFDRQHPVPAPADYTTLLAESAEAAWIATEGNAFNHATDRVPDVAALAARLRAEGRPMKDTVEVSSTGRVRQTALRADTVTRNFADGSACDVPGSFYEFISRDPLPEGGGLDLSFDSGNATGIFAMTRAA